MHESHHAYKISFSPYPGLRSFRKEENDIFFGRDDHVDLLIKKLAQSHFVCVTGPSGCGKSSLVRTGLQNSLEAGFLAGRGSDWIFCDFNPGDRPLEAMIATVAKACALLIPEHNGDDGVPTSEDEVHRMLDHGIKDPRLSNDLNRILEPLDLGGRPILLFVDQFEELFRYAQREPNAAVKFVDILLRTAAAKRGIYVVITIRTDELEKCARYTGLTGAINESQFLTPTLDRYQIQEAIEGPIAIFGGRIDPKLTVWLLNSLDEELDKLPLMQHALKLLYAHKTATDGRPDVTLGLDEFTKVFRIDTGASFSASESRFALRMTLARCLDRIYRDLPPRLKPAAARTFCALTAIDSGVSDIRRPLRLATLARTIGESEEDTRIIVKRFADGDESYLCMRGGDDGTVDVPHECILRLWPRLQMTWLANERESADNIRLLAQLAKNWDDGGKRATLARKLLAPDVLKGYTFQRFRDWRAVARPNAAWADRYLSAFRWSLGRRDAGEALSSDEIYAKISALLDASAWHRRMSDVAVKTGAVMIVALAISATFVVKHSIDRADRLDDIHAALGVLKSETAAASLPYPVKSLGNAVAGFKEAQGLGDEPSSEMAVGGAWQALAAAREIARVSSDASILGAELTPDAKALVTVDDRGTVRKWPLDQHYRPGIPVSAAPDRTLPKGGSLALALARRGGIAAVGYGNGSIRLFDLSAASMEGRPLLRDGRNPHPGFVSKLVFSPDGSRLVSSSKDGTVILWVRDPVFSLNSDANVPEHWVPHPIDMASALAADQLLAVDVREENDAIAFGLSDGRVCVMRLDPSASSDCRGGVHDAGESVKAVRFIPGRPALASAGNDDSIAIWDLTPDLALRPTGRRIFEDSDIIDIDVSEDGQLLASASKDGSVRVYDASRLRLLSTLLGHEEQVRTVRFAKTSRLLISGSFDGTARIWSPLESGIAAVGLSHQFAVRDANAAQMKIEAVAVGADGKWVAFSDGSNVYVKESGREQVDNLTAGLGASASAGGESARVSRLVAHPALPIIVASSTLPEIVVWQRIAGGDWARRIVPLRGDPMSSVRPMAISADGRLLAVAVGDTGQFDILICPLASGSSGWTCAEQVARRIPVERHSVNGGTRKPTSLRFSVSGRLLAVGSTDGAIRVFDLTVPRPEAETYAGHAGAVTAVDFSPDEKSLVSASEDKTVGIWSRTDRRSKIELVGHTDAVTGVAYSVAGRFVASVSKDKRVIVWNAKDGKPLARLPADRNGILSLDLRPTPLGTLMAIGSAGGKVDVVRFFESAEEIVGFSEAFLEKHGGSLSDRM
jgi:WD40 repeat protein/energy-coupling factor transporter ATP-binding protein EcfA2